MKFTYRNVVCDPVPAFLFYRTNLPEWKELTFRIVADSAVYHVSQACNSHTTD
jgi:hypothetical protein